MTDVREESRSHVSGKWVLLVLILGPIVVVPIATMTTLRWVESGIVETPRLNWGNRERWPSPPVRWTVPTRQGLGLSADAGPWRELDFALSPAEQTVVQQCMDLARLAANDAGAFTEPAVGSLLRQLDQRAPSDFYAIYLLGTWHRLRGETDLADAAYRMAFARAHGTVKQRYVTPEGQPVPDLAVGTFELAHARSDGHELDESLVLIYPALVTDADGYVYLPVHRTLYRVHQVPQPAGYEVEYRLEQWFDFPDRVGTLRAAVVRSAE